MGGGGGGGEGGEGRRRGGRKEGGRREVGKEKGRRGEGKGWEAVKKEKRESKKCLLQMTTNCSITSQHTTCTQVLQEYKLFLCTPVTTNTTTLINAHRSRTMIKYQG